jgi:hypothetical protein
MTLITKAKPSKKKDPDSIYPAVSFHPGRRIACPSCGNDLHFYEIAEEVMLTTRYVQNGDGSFTPQSDDSRILGEVKLYCGECQADLSQFHTRFVEMLF